MLDQILRETVAREVGNLGRNGHNHIQKITIAMEGGDLYELSIRKLPPDIEEEPEPENQVATLHYALDSWNPTAGWDWTGYTAERIDSISREFVEVVAEEIERVTGWEVHWHFGWTAASVRSFYSGQNRDWEWVEEHQDHHSIVDEIWQLVSQGQLGREYMKAPDMEHEEVMT